MSLPSPYYESHGITIYHGDYSEILPCLGGSAFDCVLTDPPFGINYQNNYTKIIHDRLAGDESSFSYMPFARECFRVLKEGTPLLAYTGWSEYPGHFRDVASVGFQMKEPLIVQKRPSGKTDLYGSFQSNADWIIFATKGRFVFRQTELVRNKKAGTIPNKGRKPVPEFKTRPPACWFGDGYPWSTENPTTEPQYRHPTRKTIELMRWLILLSTDHSASILDPFLGSGTTLVAAQMVGRACVGIEIEERFCEMAAERLRRLASSGDAADSHTTDVDLRDNLFL